MTDQAIAKSDLRSVTQNRIGKILNTAGIYGVALLFLILGVILQAIGVINNFFTASNMLNIIDAVSMLGIVAVGMAFVTYSGHYADLSVPTTMALTGIVCVEMLKFGFWPAIIIAFVVGFGIGAINAVAVGKFKANPIIWTLAMNYVTLGVIRLVWVNKQIYPDMQEILSIVVDGKKQNPPYFFTPLPRRTLHLCRMNR